MKKSKKHQNDTLQKSSIIFLQLGLILSLLFVYTVLEIELAKKDYVLKNLESTDTEIYLYPDIPNEIKIERPIRKSINLKPEIPKKVIDKIDIGKNDIPVIEPILQPSESIETAEINRAIEDLPGDTEDVPDEEMDYVDVERKPTFNECEDYIGIEQNQCFQRHIQKFINRNLTYPEIAIELGQQGRAYIEFIIDESGQVQNVKTFRNRSQYKSLDKAAIRAVQKLPKMIPGMQGGKNVKVKYVVPVNFKLN